MKTNTFKKLVFVFSLSIMFNGYSANLGLSPSSLKLAVYKFAVSADALCTNPITVVDNGSSPVDVEFVGGVNLGSGSIANGTYPCVIVEFSSNIKFTPSTNSTAANCSMATEEIMDVCRNPDTSLLIDGSTTNCTAGADRVAMYISTASASTTAADAFNPPTSIGDAAHGFNLPTALAVSGSVSGKFVVNPSGKVCDGDDPGCDGGGNAGECKMEPPLFNFTQL
jgi:hypothetical protein